MVKKIIRPQIKEGISSHAGDPTQYIRREWLVTNGLGGYSSGTVIGVMTRKYHGLLVAALPPPYGRFIMLNHLTEEVTHEDKSYFINCEEKQDGSLNIEALNYLKDFYLEDGLPVWQYKIGDNIHIQKRILMAYRQNTMFLKYKLLQGPEGVSIKLTPALNFRHHEEPVNIPVETIYVVTAIGKRYEISKKDFTPIRFCAFGDDSSFFTMQERYFHNVFFRTEKWRGYEYAGDLWSPGTFQLCLKKNLSVGIIASTENWQHIDALYPFKSKTSEVIRRKSLLNLATVDDDFTAELVLAADQFITIPEYRVEDTVRAHAFGEEIRTVIAGYHWFTDWGRDTMISLEGLTLCTNRKQEARWILKTFAYYVKEGLIPNMFPEGQNEGLYHTADATLWFFHAIDRYYTLTEDPLILEELYPTLLDILKYHLNGTQFGIGIDPNDKLLKQGMEKYQLTWMDAKVGDWVVTPRRGKAVEINALWYNALRLMQEWSQDDKKGFYKEIADQVYNSFNSRFWIEEKNYLYDVVDGEAGDDSSFRPNQIFSISLKYPVLEEKKWESVLTQVKEKLLTPFGLRTLSKDHPDFKANYEGDLRARDAAYHQGTVWPWLIGPFIDAWLKVYPGDLKMARSFLESFSTHLSDAGIGTISEIFDATPPYNPRGCMAQAWSVAEVLRTWLKTKS